MKCTCGQPLPDPVIDAAVGSRTSFFCSCGIGHLFTIPDADDILLTQIMTNGRVNKPFGDQSPCPVCEEMMPSPVIEADGKATVTTCGNCGMSRTIAVSGEDATTSKPVPPDGKLWN